MAEYSGHSPRHATKAGEHANPFGLKPSHSSMAGKRNGFISAANKRLKTTLWSKGIIRLRFMDQTKAPDTMQLAQVELGLNDLKFDSEGDARHMR